MTDFRPQFPVESPSLPKHVLASCGMTFVRRPTIFGSIEELDSRMHALTGGVTIVPAGLGSLVADIGAFAQMMLVEWVWRDSEPWLRRAHALGYSGGLV